MAVFPWERMQQVVTEKYAYFDHSVLFFVGLIESFHELSEIVEFFERRVKDRAMWYCFEVHKKYEKNI
jgi:hypothetical protein